MRFFGGKRFFRIFFSTPPIFTIFYFRSPVSTRSADARAAQYSTGHPSPHLAQSSTSNLPVLLRRSRLKLPRNPNLSNVGHPRSPNFFFVVHLRSPKPSSVGYPRSPKPSSAQPESSAYPVVQTPILFCRSFNIMNKKKPNLRVVKMKDSPRAYTQDDINCIRSEWVEFVGKHVLPQFIGPMKPYLRQFIDV
uniref:Uncharacterized protein n=1 Tax=Cucumis melo TaxID=3656 RepID=A0A9I9EIL8_CUCME